MFSRVTSQHHQILKTLTVHMTTAAENSWSFELVDHASKNTFLPNIKIWNVSNHQGLNYQILVSWPLDWTSPEEAQGNALSM